MQVEVYGDILCLINGGMDGLCLLLTAKLLHIPRKNWRLLLASMVGGVYAVIALVMDVGQMGALILDVGVCLLMCGIAFGRRKEISRLPLWCGVYVAISMVMGGVMTALYQLLRRGGVDRWLPMGEDGLSSLVFVLLAGVGGALTYAWGKFFRQKQAIRDGVLTIQMGGVTLTLSAMVDSGNLLCDPMGGGVVIPVRRQALANLLSPQLQKHLQTQSQENFDHATLWDCPEACRIRLIPTATAMGEGMLWAFLPDAVTFAPVGKSPYAVHALIAPTSLPSCPADALIPSELLG